MSEVDPTNKPVIITVPVLEVEVQPDESTWNLWVDVEAEPRKQFWVLEKDEQEVHRSEDLTECRDIFRDQTKDGDVMLGGLFTFAIENDPKPYEAWPKEEQLPFPDNETLRGWGA